MTKIGCKRGAISNKEKKFIEANLDKSIEWLAKKIDRTKAFVKKYVGERKQHVDFVDKEDYVHQLRASSFWDATKKGLMSDEISYFEHEWAKYLEQFSSIDMTNADQTMIKDLINLDIWCNRFQERSKSIINQIRILRDKLAKELEKSDKDMYIIDTYEKQIGGLQDEQKNYIKNYKEYQQEKNKKLIALQAADLERLREKTSAKDIWSVLKELDSEKMRIKEGALNEKVKVSVSNLEERWQQPMKYADGSYDYPMLTPEQMLKLKEKSQIKDISDRSKRD